MSIQGNESTAEVANVSRSDSIHERCDIEAPKKPRSEKQIAAFAKCREAMMAKRAANKQKEEIIVLPVKKLPQKPRRVMVIPDDEEDDIESPPPSPKKKTRSRVKLSKSQPLNQVYDGPLPFVFSVV
jgi:hypothetical protein